jgi:hypothetical protein
MEVRRIKGTHELIEGKGVRVEAYRVERMRELIKAKVGSVSLGRGVRIAYVRVYTWEGA